MGRMAPVTLGRDHAIGAGAKIASWLASTSCRRRGWLAKGGGSSSDDQRVGGGPPWHPVLTPTAGLTRMALALA
jgi:hypothetical protein